VRKKLGAQSPLGFNPPCLLTVNYSGKETRCLGCFRKTSACYLNIALSYVKIQGVAPLRRLRENCL